MTSKKYLMPWGCAWVAIGVCACAQVAMVTQTPEPSAPPAAPATPAPIATLSPSASATEVSRLWFDNGNCALPCFWGMSPGVVPASDAVELFHRLGADFVVDITATGIAYAPVDPDTMGLLDRITFRLPARDVSPDGYVVRMVVENEKVAAIEVGGQGDRFLLAPLLRELGQPDQIYVHATIPGPVDAYPFVLMLFYEKGISVNFAFEAEFDVDRSVIRACPATVRPLLFLWGEDYDYSLDRAVEYMVGDPSLPPRAINDATGLSIAEFTRLFADPQAQECLETPEHLWTNLVAP